MGRLTTILVAAGAIGLILVLVVFAMNYGAAPATVPTHFGPSGAPNAWGPKSTFLLFPILGVVFFAFAVLAMTLVAAISAAKIPPALPALTGLVFVEVIWVLAFTEMGSFAVALGKTAGLSNWIVIGIGAVMLTALAIVINAIAFALRNRS